CNGEAFYHELRADRRLRLPIQGGDTSRAVTGIGYYFLTVSTTANLLSSGTTSGHEIYLLNLFKRPADLVSGKNVVWFPARGLSPVVGLLAAFAFALYKPDIFYVAEVDKTCLSVFLTAAVLALAFGRSLAARLATGLALGLAALTRANFLLFAPLGFAALLLLDRRALAALVFAAGLAVVLVPVAARNRHLSGEWVLTTSQAGQNFYTGNNPTNPWGAYGGLPFVRSNPHFEEADFRAAAEVRVGHPLGPRDVSRFWFAEALAHMRAHPAFAARAMLLKLVLFWNDFEISDSQDQYLLERDSPVLRLPLL